MDQNYIYNKLILLSAKLTKLVSEHNHVCEDLHQTKAINQILKKEIEQKNEEIKNFQNQLKISKIVSSLAESSHNSSELKLKINEYIKEIDRCIAHLSE